MAPYVRVGKYILKKKIGEGAFAEVRHAMHEETGEEFAVKVFDRSIVSRNAFESDVKKEIRIMQHLRHPNIVSIHAVLVTTKKMYLVMELVRGGELYDEIVSRRRIDEDTSRKYFQQLVDAMVYCHQRGVVHRDLKPENLLLDSNGNLKVTDFGMSWMKSRSQDASKTLLRTQCGTPKYMAPEVIVRPPGGYDGEKLDAWECGMVLFALLAGYLPFAGDNDNAVFHSILNGSIQFPDFFSTGARDVLTMLLQKNPQKRAGLDQIRSHSWFQVNYKGEDREKIAYPTIPILDPCLSLMNAFAKPEGGNTSQGSHGLGGEYMSASSKESTAPRLQNAKEMKLLISSTSPNFEKPASRQPKSTKVRNSVSEHVHSLIKRTPSVEQDHLGTKSNSPRYFANSLSIEQLNARPIQSNDTESAAYPISISSPEEKKSSILPINAFTLDNSLHEHPQTSISPICHFPNTSNCPLEKYQLATTAPNSGNSLQQMPNTLLGESRLHGESGFSTGKQSPRDVSTKATATPQVRSMHSSFYEMLLSPTTPSPSQKYNKLSPKSLHRKMFKLKPDTNDMELNEALFDSPSYPSCTKQSNPSQSFPTIQKSHPTDAEEDIQRANISRSKLIPASLNFTNVLRMPNLSPLRLHRNETEEIESPTLSANGNELSFKSIFRQRRSPRADRPELMRNNGDSSWFCSTGKVPLDSPRSIRKGDRSPRLLSKLHKGRSLSSFKKTMRGDIEDDVESSEEEHGRPQPASSPWRFFYGGSPSKAK